MFELSLNFIKMAKINNVTCTAEIGNKLNLKECYDQVSKSELFSQVKFNPSKFGALIIKFNGERITHLLWPSGKLVITGGKLPRYNYISALRLISVLNKIFDHQNFNMMNFHVVNIQATGSVGHEVRLDLLANEDGVYYQPELFPGLDYKPFQDKNVKILFFSSGKFVITGVNEIQSIEKIHSNALDILTKYKINH